MPYEIEIMGLSRWNSWGFWIRMQNIPCGNQTCEKGGKKGITELSAREPGHEERTWYYIGVQWVVSNATFKSGND